MNKVQFRPSDQFKKIADKVFQEQRKRILDKIPNSNVQHIGSTAIPNIITKGDLDIQVRVKEDDFGNAIKILKEIYEINQSENWSKTYASFKDDSSFELPIGVQLTIIDSEDDNLFQTQQLLLLKDGKILEEYNQMKLRFQGKDIEEYRKERAKFFAKLTKTNH